MRIEKAISLAIELDLEGDELCLHLLKDVLPINMFKKLGLDKHLATEAAFDSVEEEVKRLREENAYAHRALARGAADHEMEVGEDVVALLDGNMDILPVIHFIYMRASCDFDEVESVMRRNLIKRSLQEILNDLERYDLAVIDREANKVRRHLAMFRIPQTRAGQKFKAKFVSQEVEKSFSRPRGMQCAEGSTWSSSMIFCIDPNRHGSLIDQKIGDLHAALLSSEATLDEPGTVPFFFNLILSSREEYDGCRDESISTNQGEQQ